MEYERGLIYNYMNLLSWGRTHRKIEGGTFIRARRWLIPWVKRETVPTSSEQAYSGYCAGGCGYVFISVIRPIREDIRCSRCQP